MFLFLMMWASADVYGCVGLSGVPIVGLPFVQLHKYLRKIIGNIVREALGQ